jgi:serine/threonine protein kinase
MAFLHSSLPSAKPVLFHQDLKTANVLLSIQDGALRGKISDFGLSFLKEFQTDEEAVNHNGGTRFYLAPEIMQKVCLLSLNL